MTNEAPARRIVLPAWPFLYAIIDASMTGSRTLTEWVREVCGSDRASVVQWRFKGLKDSAALAGARELRAATRERGVLLFINDRPDIARMIEADGVHVGQGDLTPADVRALLPHALVGVSTHNPREFEAALCAPVDYIAVGPVFGTTSKANPDRTVGLDFVSWARARTSTPLVAIGGITVANAHDVIRAGAKGVAVISNIMKAERPEEAARDLLAAIRRGAGGITSHP